MAGEYLARCAAEAISLRPEDVGRYAHEVTLLAWKCELKARLEDVGDLLAKGDPADLLVALRCYGDLAAGGPQLKSAARVG